MAVNPLRGEAELKVGETTYKLVLDVNGFCMVQPVLNMRPMEMLDIFQSDPDDMVVPRAILWGALQKHHPCHLIEAGEIMADAGLLGTRQVLAELLAASFGLGKPAEDKDQGDPPKGKKTRGTG